jgi:hypothetical protein
MDPRRLLLPWKADGRRSEGRREEGLLVAMSDPNCGDGEGRERKRFGYGGVVPGLS